ncbi:MAG: hypothetical protein QOH03_5202, partial [Kribbellaceae bacterium]|nr:hypothetical protein [Kribbellaceae bacterium]
MKLSRKMSAAAIAALAPLGLALSAGPASALPSSDFIACSDSSIECRAIAYSYGTIIWSPGDPTVSGSVLMPLDAGYTVKVTFDAFTATSSTRADSVNRAVTPSYPDGRRPFSFTIGKGQPIKRVK